MKEQIYTIPLNEAFDENSECPFCTLKRKANTDILDFVLGPSYMEEDIREETDKIGFCKEHYKEMFEAQNRLGVALMLSTHLKKLIPKIDDLLNKELSLDKPLLFKKSANKGIEEFSNKLSSSCYACNKINSRMDNYFDTFIYLWKTELDFREKVKNCKGFCIEHLSRIVAEGKKKLSDKKYKEFISVIAKIEKGNIKRIDEELDWFIKKFDYRFQNEPWKNSKDAVERAIQKLSSADL